MIARFLMICVASAALTACGSAAKREGQGRGLAADPPGVAEKLSLGGKAQTEPAGSYQGAVNCVVALRVTARTLQSMSTGNQAREMGLIAVAEKNFRDRALAAEGVSERQIATDIERGIQQNATDPGRQAQLAIACLRTLQPAGA